MFWIIFYSLGPMSSKPVAFEESRFCIKEETCCVVIGGILKYMFSGILLLIKFINLVKSDGRVALLSSFSRVDTEVK